MMRGGRRGKERRRGGRFGMVELEGGEGNGGGCMCVHV